MLTSLQYPSDPIHRAAIQFRDEARQNYEEWEEEVARHEIASGNRSLCTYTLKPHALVSFHSEGAMECIDCEARFKLDEPFLTTHRRNSTL